MSGYTNRFTEEHRVDCVEYPDSIAIGTHDSAWLSMRDYHRALVLVLLGDMAGGATLDVALRQATTIAGGGAIAVTGKSITQLTQVGGDGNAVCAIELQTEELDVDNAFDCIGVRAIVAGAAVEYSIVILRFEPRFEAVDFSNLQEVVT